VGFPFGFAVVGAGGLEAAGALDLGGTDLEGGGIEDFLWLVQF